MSLNISIFRNIPLLLIVSLTSVLSACQSAGFHQAYDGPQKPDNEVASIVIPASFNLQFLDKEKYHSPFTQDGAQIKTLPGNHHLILYFQEYWDIPGDDYERVESKPISINLSTEAGHHYYLKFSKPNDLDEARAFGKKPSIEFIDSTTNTKASTVIKYDVYTRSFFSDMFGENNPETPAPAPSPSTQTAPAPPEQAKSIADQDTKAPTVPAPMAEATTPAPPTFAPPRSHSDISPSTKEDNRALDMLKYWWENADKAQKDSFKEWLNTH